MQQEDVNLYLQEREPQRERRQLPFFNVEGEYIGIQDQCALYKCDSINGNYTFLVKELMLFNFNQFNCFYLLKSQESACQLLQREISTHRNISQHLQTNVTRFGLQSDIMFSKTFCSAGSILDLINSRVQITLETKNYLSTQILRSLFALHHIGFAHLTLRPSAIRLSSIYMLSYDLIQEPQASQVVYDFFLQLAGNNVLEIQHDLRDVLNQILNNGMINIQPIPFDQRETFEQNFTQQVGLLQGRRLSDQQVLNLIRIIAENLQQQSKTFRNLLVNTLRIYKYYAVFLDEFQNSVSTQQLAPIFRPNHNYRQYMHPLLQQCLYERIPIEGSLYRYDMYSFGVILTEIYGYKQQSYFHSESRDQLKQWVQNMPQIYSEQQQFILSMLDDNDLQAIQTWQNFDQYPFLNQNSTASIQAELEIYVKELNQKNKYQQQQL